MSEFNFKNTGLSIQEYKLRNRSKESFENQTDNIPLGIKLPLEKGTKSNETLFKMNFNRSDQISNNLKVLLMTRKGEVLGLPDFGTNLIDIYNRGDLDNIEELAMSEIGSAVRQYTPQVNLEDFTSEFISSENQDNYYKLDITYSTPDQNSLAKQITIKIKTSR